MLTNAAAKAAGATDRAYKLHDQGGLFLHVAATGTKTWRQKYRWRGREKLLVHGRFPELNLAQARMRCLEAKDMLSRGTDPANAAAKCDSANTFEQLARAWHRHNQASWSTAHAGEAIAGLERDVFGELGALGPDAIGAPALLKVLRAIEARGCVATAQRVRQRLSEIFRYGIAEGLCSSNPAATLGAALKDTPPATPHPALTSIEDCRALLAACELVDARPMTRLASRFLALTAVRLDSVRGTRWDELEELDGDQPLWRVPPARLKLKRAKKGEDRFEHLVPLSAARARSASSTSARSRAWRRTASRSAGTCRMAGARASRRSSTSSSARAGARRSTRRSATPRATRSRRPTIARSCSSGGASCSSSGERCWPGSQRAIESLPMFRVRSSGRG